MSTRIRTRTKGDLARVRADGCRGLRASSDHVGQVGRRYSLGFSVGAYGTGSYAPEATMSRSVRGFCDRYRLTGRSAGLFLTTAVPVGGPLPPDLSQPWSDFRWSVVNRLSLIKSNRNRFRAGQFARKSTGRTLVLSTNATDFLNVRCTGRVVI